MGKCRSSDGPCFFSLTSLQIGDLQSYLSNLTLFLAPESKNFYILVDNRPWVEDLASRPAHLWQLMVTKSRLSPFANSRGRKQSKVSRECNQFKGSPEVNKISSHKLNRWFSLMDAASLSSKRALLPVKKLRSSLLLNSKLHSLYGFIIFEVSWNDVRGINYLNELQTDTSLAIEAKHMRRWEFDSIAQAASCISLWFPGTPNDRFLLEEHLYSGIGDVFCDAPETFSPFCTDNEEDILNFNMFTGAESPSSHGESFNVHSKIFRNQTCLLQTPPSDRSCKRRKLSEPPSVDSEVDFYNEDDYSDSVDSIPAPCTSAFEDASEAIQYRDVLLLVRFNDHDLPYKLKEIIISDLRLLTLLEAGLPSWVIFLQSYPGFSHLYRPWMCPLARALYVLVSVATVLIGFYDLYKNVPVLKATASRLCGPLLDWIETWEMVSRIRYLGTMLFLHNFRKSLSWFFMITHTTRSFLALLLEPLARPCLLLFEVLLPFWKLLIQMYEDFFSFIWIIMESSWNLVWDLVEIVFLPVWFMISITWRIATSVLYPLFWLLWEIINAPIRLLLHLSSLVSYIFNLLYDVVQDLWVVLSGIFKFASSAEATKSAYEVSLLRSLWDDLFSQVFRAVRSILNGFVAFFAACNRHRLSIYNYVMEIIQRHYCPVQRSHSLDSGHRLHTPEMPYLSEPSDER